MTFNVFSGWEMNQSLRRSWKIERLTFYIHPKTDILRADIIIQDGVLVKNLVSDLEEGDRFFISFRQDLEHSELLLIRRLK